MFSTNPFAELSASIDPAIMQTYVIVMILCVVLGAKKRAALSSGNAAGTGSGSGAA